MPPLPSGTPCVHIAQTLERASPDGGPDFSICMSCSNGPSHNVPCLSTSRAACSTAASIQHHASRPWRAQGAAHVSYRAYIPPPGDVGPQESSWAAPSASARP